MGQMRMTRDDFIERERELAQQLASALETIQELRRQPDDLFAALARTETAEGALEKSHEQVRMLQAFIDDLDGNASASRTLDSFQVKGWIMALRRDMETSYER